MESNKARIMPVIWRSYFVLFTFILAVPAAAQTQTATGGGIKRITSTPKAAYNSMSKDTTPYNCEGWRGHPHPGMVKFCEGIEASTLQNEARRAGRPGPSSSVVALPAMGSAEARASGMACIGGQAMRKLPNGWEQVSSPSGGWQRCKER